MDKPPMYRNIGERGHEKRRSFVQRREDRKIERKRAG